MNANPATKIHLMLRTAANRLLPIDFIRKEGWFRGGMK